MESGDAYVAAAGFCGGVGPGASAPVRALRPVRDQPENGLQVLAPLPSVRDGAAALWRTTDAGAHWSVVPSPHDQKLHQVEEGYTRVEQIATIGDWLLVREHGRVFVTPAASIHWRALPGIRDIASEPGGEGVFVLTDSLQPALLDKDLHTVWKGAPLPIPIEHPSRVKQVVFRGGRGYVTESFGAIHEVRNGKARVVRPADRTR